MLELAERTRDFQMSDEEFALFANYHLATCEKKELLGSQTHLLYICKKKRIAGNRGETNAAGTAWEAGR